VAETATAAVLAEPGDRGRLVVADRAVTRIAEAAAFVPGTARRSGVVGSVLGRNYPDVSCTVAGRRARVGVEVAGVWPHPAPEIAARVRDAVRTALQEFAGLTVDDVSVVVADYLPEPETTRRVL
jgi:uncharacterized alkaline shock family protein YloU